MIIASNGTDCDPELLDQMFRLRAKSFYERRGWRVKVANNKEIDQFDELNPLYLMAVDNSGVVVGALRLLQTTGPNMLTDVFPEVLGDEPQISSPLIWESTRFCVDTRYVRSRSNLTVNSVTSELLEGLFTLASEMQLEFIVSVYDLYMERILKRAGCLFERYGTIAHYDGGLKTVAGLFDVGPHVVASIQQAGTSVIPTKISGNFWDQVAA